MSSLDQVINVAGNDVSLMVVANMLLSAYGGFPSPPKFYQRFVRTPYGRFVLLYLTGVTGLRGQDLVTPGIASLLAFSLTEVLSL